MSDANSQFVLPTPGENHLRLQPFAGAFRAEVKVWMGPGDPHVSSGTMVNSFELNGLYLQQDYKGDLIEGPYPPFQGKGFWGYNATKKQFEGFWIDTASSQMQTESGDVDATGKVWEMRGVFELPSGGTMNRRTVITLVDDDNHRMEAFHTMPGTPERKTMEINYTRA